MHKRSSYLCTLKFIQINCLVFKSCFFWSFFLPCPFWVNAFLFSPQREDVAFFFIKWGQIFFVFSFVVNLKLLAKNETSPRCMTFELKSATFVITYIFLCFFNWNHKLFYDFNLIFLFMTSMSDIFLSYDFEVVSLFFFYILWLWSCIFFLRLKFFVLGFFLFSCIFFSIFLKNYN